MQQQPEVFVLIGSYEELGRTIMIFHHKVVNPEFNIEEVGQLYQCLMHFDMIDNPSTICIVWSFFHGHCLFLVSDNNKNINEMNTNPSLITIIAHADSKFDVHFSREQLLQQYRNVMLMKRQLKYMMVSLFDLKCNVWSIETPSIDCLNYYVSANALENATSEDIGRICYYQTNKQFK